MKLVALSLLLFAGIIGTYGDVQCVNGKVQLCVATLQTATACEKVDDLDTCFKAALKDCKEESMSELGEITKALKDICTPGNDLNKKYENNKDCLNTYAGTGAAPCIEALQKVIADFPTDATAEKLKEYANKLCGAMSAMFPCFYDGVEKACNKESRDVVEAVVKPYAKMVTKACAGAGGGAGTSALSWTLLAAASLLFVLWH